MGHGHNREQGRLTRQDRGAAPQTTTLQIFILGKTGLPKIQNRNFLGSRSNGSA
jgi:hypothetical protein